MAKYTLLYIIIGRALRISGLFLAINMKIPIFATELIQDFRMKRLFIALSALASCQLAQADIIINEIMQSNIDAVMDDTNEFPDSWVELYNTGTESVNLKDYKLGITDDPETAWTLSSVTIGANQYKLVYCDKQAKKMHTDYRLESGKGCCVYLFKDGVIIDSVVDLKKQPAPNIAYGRKVDAGDEWGYQAQPTPNEANCGELCSQLLGDPIFSEKGRVMTNGSAFTLTVTMPADTPEGTELRYTTNGSEPDQTSQLFPAEGLSISDTRVVRVKPFCNGYLSPRSSTQSYIFFPRDFTIPVVSIVTNDKYFNDKKLGIYVDGTYGGGKKNYEYDWRRPINMELFTAEGEESELNQLCETRVAGAASRGAQLKSLALYAHKRFGEKRFEYEFFPEQRPGIKKFKSFLMRNAGNDFDYLYMRDAIIQANMAAHTDLDYQAYRPAIFYLNGKYKGMLNIRERSNEDNIYTNYDGLEDIDMIENWTELKAGTIDAWNAFGDFYTQQGHTWEEYEQYMDLYEFINLMIMNLYYCNLDFPGNNFVSWRPTAEGGRWRFVAKDTDFGLGLYGRSSSYNTIEWIYNPNYDYNNAWANKSNHTRLFRHLMEDEKFKREFIDRCAIYMGDFLNFDGTWKIWEPMYDAIKYEYPNHRKLINEWWPNYNDELNNAKSWMNKRTDRFYKMVADYYQLGAPTALTVNTNMTDEQRAEVSVAFNGVTLSENRFSGKFFQGRAITLQATPAEGRSVTGWSVKVVGKSGSIDTFEITGDTYTFDMPECSSCEVEVMVSDAQGINEVQTDECPSPVGIYDIRGIRRDRLAKGQNIVVMSDGSVRKVLF